ncbi:hypothetical protein FRB99_007335 [Tulasnella sp. 403]|nr:hypothetical protein FRB99_007335 [Tulasnella sp. 403]
MNRQSTLAARPSHAGGPGVRAAPASQSVASKLLEKRQEWEAIAALDDATAEIVRTLEKIAAQSNIMADGGRAVAAVMANWPNVLHIISLFTKDASGAAVADEDPDEPNTSDLPRLVRIDANGLTQANGN